MPWRIPAHCGEASRKPVALVRKTMRRGEGAWLRALALADSDSAGPRFFLVVSNNLAAERRAERRLRVRVSRGA